MLSILNKAMEYVWMLLVVIDVFLMKNQKNSEKCIVTAYSGGLFDE